MGVDEHNVFAKNGKPELKVKLMQEYILCEVLREASATAIALKLFRCGERHQDLDLLADLIYIAVSIGLHLMEEGVVSFNE